MLSVVKKKTQYHCLISRNNVVLETILKQLIYIYILKTLLEFVDVKNIEKKLRDNCNIINYQLHLIY